MARTFTNKQIELRITLASGSFGGGGSAVNINGLPIECSIEKSGGYGANKATVSVKGMAYSDMEQLTTLAFKPFQFKRNAIEIYAGDAETGLVKVFAGIINSAYADFNSAPEVTFKMECITGYYAMIYNAPPVAYKGTVDLSGVIAQQAKEAGMTFTNKGCTSKLQNSIFQGDPISKAKAAAKQAGAILIIDDDEMILLPEEGERDSHSSVLSANSGLIGYPSISSDGIHVSALFSPEFRVWSTIEIDTIVPKASGKWRITKLTHKLAANNSGGGAWQSDMTCNILSWLG